MSAAFFKKIGSQLGKLADIINGNDPGEEDASPEIIAEQPAKSAPKPRSVEVPEEEQTTTPAEELTEEEPTGKPQPAEPKSGNREKTPPEPEPKAKPRPKPAEKPQPSKQEIFDNAIDKRDLAIRYIVDEFREVIGSTSQAIASLYVYVIVDREDYDVKRYAWADGTMREQLRLSLDNAMLEGVGKKVLELRLIMKDDLPKSAKLVVADTLYYSFAGLPTPDRRVRATVTVVEGTGSLAKEIYQLDSEKKKTYNIGRGPMANKPGAIRPNDIVDRDNDPDADLQQRNNHVSSAHASIVASGGRLFLKALKWGCRPMGGSPTKLIYNDAEHELRDTIMKYPLNDGYMIRLGNEVVLLFNTEDY